MRTDTRPRVNRSAVLHLRVPGPYPVAIAAAAAREDMTPPEWLRRWLKHALICEGYGSLLVATGATSLPPATEKAA